MEGIDGQISANSTESSLKFHRYGNVSVHRRHYRCFQGGYFDSWQFKQAGATAYRLVPDVCKYRVWNQSWSIANFPCFRNDLRDEFFYYQRMGRRSGSQATARTASGSYSKISS